MSDAPPAGCEVCAAGPLVRVLYPVAVHFKGSGFYSTDYGRRGQKKDAASSESGEKSEKKDKSEKVEKVEKKAAEA